MEKFYTRAEVAEMLHVTTRTIDRWLKAGILQGAKIGKRWVISESDIQRTYDYFKANSTNSTEDE